MIDGPDLSIRDREAVGVEAAGKRAGRAKAADAKNPAPAPIGIRVAEYALQVDVPAADVAVLDDDRAVLADACTAWAGCSERSAITLP